MEIKNMKNTSHRLFRKKLFHLVSLWKALRFRMTQQFEERVPKVDRRRTHSSVCTGSTSTEARTSYLESNSDDIKVHTIMGTNTFLTDIPLSLALNNFLIIMYSTYMLNRMGDTIQPCGTPAAALHMSVFYRRQDVSDKRRRPAPPAPPPPPPSAGR